MIYRLHFLIFVFVATCVARADVTADASLWLQNTFEGKTCGDLSEVDLANVKSYLKINTCSPRLGNIQSSVKNLNNIVENIFFNEQGKKEFDQTTCEIGNTEQFAKDSSLVNIRAQEISDKLPFIKEQMKFADRAYFEYQQVVGQNNNFASLCRNSTGQARETCFKDLDQKRINEAALEIVWQRHRGLTLTSIASLWKGSTETMMSFVQGLARRDPFPSQDVILSELKKQIPIVTKELKKNKFELEEQSSSVGRVRNFDNLSDTTKRHLIENALNEGLFKEAVEKEDESTIKLLCRLEGKYTKGRDKLNHSIGAATLLVGGFAGLLAKIPLAVRAGQIGNILAKTRNSAAVISAVSTGIDAAVVANSIRQKCVSNNLLFSIKNACPANPEEVRKAELQEMENGNCVLDALLAVAPAGILASSKAIKSVTQKIALYRVDASNPQIRLWRLMESSGSSTIVAKALERKMEQTLLQGEVDLSIFGMEKLSGNRGSPYLITFKDGTKAVWKVDGAEQSAASEVAAYALDKKLGLNRVPMTVERTIDGKTGSLQVFVSNTDRVALQDLTRQSSPFTIVDDLMNNFDRHDGNYLTHKGRPIGIDQGASFGTGWTSSPDTKAFVDGMVRDAEQSRRYVETLRQEAAQATGQNAVELKERIDMVKRYNDMDELKDRQKLISMLGDRTTYDRLVGTSEQEWRKLFAQLNEEQFSRFLERRQRIINAVKDAERVFGREIFSSGPVSPLVRERTFETVPGR